MELDPENTVLLLLLLFLFECFLQFEFVKNYYMNKI